MPNVGDAAPDFTLLGASGNSFTLSSLKGSKRALLVFYPEDMTSGCTDQLAALRETIDDFRGQNTEILGINEGDAESHRRFIEHLRLQFDLLIDEDLRVSDAYEALQIEGTVVRRKLQRISRTVVIVGKDGNVIYRSAGAPPPGELLLAIENAKDEPTLSRQ
jgi:peroxiredoxin Q/BCP